MCENFKILNAVFSGTGPGVGGKDPGEEETGRGGRARERKKEGEREDQGGTEKGGPGEGLGRRSCVEKAGFLHHPSILRKST